MRNTADGIPPVIVVDRKSTKPLYRQIYDSFREAIVDRRLRGGQRLPSTRALAAELRISRVPVLNAFDQLLAEGYFESRRGAGTFVASTLPDDPRARRGGNRQVALVPGPREIARGPASALELNPEPWYGGNGPFRMSEPAVDQFPLAIWSRLVARHCRTTTRRSMLYGSVMGSLPFRQTIAAYLRTARAVRCEPEQVMVVSGSQQALEITARALIDPGQPVWVEEPGYKGAREAFGLMGAKLVPVPVDESGLQVSEGVSRAPRARAVVVTPSHQYPLGVAMSAARRLELIEWAQTTGAWIVEDDYDSEYRYESQPIASLQGLDRDSRVIYIGTFSKVLFPALRVGYLVIPPDLVPRFGQIREAMDIFPPALHSAVLGDFIGEGHFARHLRRMRALYADRRSVLVESLKRELGESLRVIGSEAGFHLTALFDMPTDDRIVAERAAGKGLWAMPLSACYLEAPQQRGLVLGYGGCDVKVIPTAVRRLKDIVFGY
jgi:GntR family transcriptional regulator/MocR family aminotransferase